MSKSAETLSKIKELDNERKLLKESSSKSMPFYFLGPLVVLLLSAFSGTPVVMMFMTVIAGIASGIIYHSNFTSPFNSLKHQVKKALLDEFVQIYHPTINHKYIGKEHKVKDIIRASKLISADRYNEEDVITGSKRNLDFYLSEIDLEDKRTDSDNKTTYHTIFKGLLFKIKLKNKSFPRSQLYTQPNMLKRWFGSIQKNAEFGFWYETEDENRFQNEMKSLFPFIRHLSQKGDIRISIQDDEITMLMESDMKFLDDPEPTLSRSFEDETYYAKMSQQLNSLLFIVDSFADELSPLEIEEELKLRVLEYAERRMW